MADETRVRTEKTGRIGHEAVAEATYVSDRSRAQSPTDTAFLFCKAFFFVPFASKKKASSGEGPAAKVAVCSVLSVSDPPRVAVSKKKAPSGEAPAGDQ